MKQFNKCMVCGVLVGLKSKYCRPCSETVREQKFNERQRRRNKK